MMAVIFPFESAYYEAENVPVRYVGHPSIDKVIPKLSKQDALATFDLNSDVPVGGLVASTLPINDTDFLSEKYSFLRTGATTASLTNQTWHLVIECHQ